MDPPREGRQRNLRNPTLSVIAVEERRAILKAIIKWASLTEEQLTEYIAATKQGMSIPYSERLATVHTNLIHSHLPALEAAGLITWDQGRIDSSGHPAFQDSRFEQILRTESGDLDTVLLGLSHDYRRIVLTALWSGQETMSGTALANAIRYCQEMEGAPGSIPVEEITVALQHVHLPLLAEMSLIEYDPESGRAGYSSHSTLEKVFTIIYNPEGTVVDKYDGFFAGVLDSYRKADLDRGYHASWPHNWGDLHHG